MRTPILLLAALSIVAGSAYGQTIAAQALLRVDPTVQRQRDQTRTAILQDEVVAEALSLAEAQALLRSDAVRTDARAAQEATKRIARHRQNISELARELAQADRQGALAARSSPAAGNVTRAAVDQMPPAFAEPAPPRRNVTGTVPEWLISGSEAGRTP